MNQELSTPEIMGCMYRPCSILNPLQPLMISPAGGDPRPDRYIINIFCYGVQVYRFDMPNPPHSLTNMVKAALNMLTRIFGGELAKKHRIYELSRDRLIS